MPAVPEKGPFADVKPHGAPPEPGPRRINRVFDVLLVLAFVAALGVPSVGTWLHWDFHNAPKENRVLATMPAAPRTWDDATQYSDAFFAYFKDHFGFRNTLIHNFEEGRLRTGLLTNNSNVLIGKQGWLFFSVRSDQSYLKERGFQPFGDWQLESWQKLLEQREAYFRKRGIVYLMVFAPDKQSIYPEYLPAGTADAKPGRLDQLITWLAAHHSTARVLDLRPALLAAKMQEKVYYQTDTHWNTRGALVAYGEVLKSLQARLPAYGLQQEQRDAFAAYPMEYFSGDLVPMLGLEGQLHEDDVFYTRPEPYLGNPATQRAPVDPAKPGTLVMFHDSFGEFLMPMLGPRFNRAYFQRIDCIVPEVIDTMKPVVVINQMVERKLYYDPVPEDPPAVTNDK